MSSDRATWLIPQSAPFTDSYDIVLTAQPNAPVVINVVPKPTRTYNSADAFNPDANFGQNDEIQVRVATTRQHVVLGGAVTPNEVWALVVRTEDSKASMLTGSGVALILRTVGAQYFAVRGWRAFQKGDFACPKGPPDAPRVRREAPGAGQ